MSRSYSLTIILLNGLFFLLLILSLSHLSHASASPTTVWTVNHTADDWNPGSLRWAIQQAETDGDGSLILFNISTMDPGYDPTTGKWTITLTGDLTWLSLESNTTIDGGGKIIIDGSNFYIFSITAENITLKNLELKNSPIPVRFYDGDNATLENLIIHDTGSYGVYGDGATEDLEIHSCTIYSTGSWGVDYWGNSLLLEDSNLSFSSAGGIYLQNTVGAQIRRTIIHNHNLQGVDLNNVLHILITDCSIYQLGSAGIAADSSTQDVKIVGSEVSHTSSYCITLSSRDNLIENCTLTFALSGIHLLNSDNSTIRTCIIYNHSDSCILLETSTNTKIESCKIYYAESNYGVYITSGSSKVLIRDCTIHHNNISGISIDASSDVNISDNRIYSHSFDGVSTVSNSHSIYIYRNTIYDCGNGIACNIAHDIHIWNNEIYLFTWNGISLIQSTSIKIFSNRIYHGLDGVAARQSTSVNISFNHIYGNTKRGIYLFQSSTDFLIMNNTIEDDSWCGVVLEGNSNDGVVGGNIILNNGGIGVNVTSSENITITQNLFGGNGNLAIDLSPQGINFNDGILNAAQSNRGIDYPVITNITLLPGNILHIEGYINIEGAGSGSPTFGNAKIELYLVNSGSGDCSGGECYGEGTSYITSFNADVNGEFNLNLVVIGVAIPNGSYLSATATLNDIGTSEFGPNIRAMTVASRIEIAPENRTILSGECISYQVTAYDDFGNSWDVTLKSNLTIDPSAGGRWVSNTYCSIHIGLWEMNASYKAKNGNILRDHTFLSVEGIPYTFRVEKPFEKINVDGIYYDPPVTFRWEVNTVHNISVPSIHYIGRDTRHRFVGWSDGYSSATRQITASPPGGTYTAYIIREYKVLVYTPYSYACCNGWVEEGSQWRIHLKSSIAINRKGDMKYRFVKWLGVGESAYRGRNLSFIITVNSPVRETALWEPYQYLLKVETPYSVAQGGGWKDVGSVVSISLKRTTVPLGEGVRAVFRGWRGDYTGNKSTFSMLMNSPKSVEAIWVIQYRVRFSTTPEIDLGMPPEEWRDNGSRLYLSLPEIVPVSDEERLCFLRMLVNGSVVEGRVLDIYVSAPLDIYATYFREYLIVIKTNIEKFVNIYVDSSPRGLASHSKVLNLWLEAGKTYFVSVDKTVWKGCGEWYVAKSSMSEVKMDRPRMLYYIYYAVNPLMESLIYILLAALTITILGVVLYLKKYRGWIVRILPYLSILLTVIVLLSTTYLRCEYYHVNWHLSLDPCNIAYLPILVIILSSTLILLYIKRKLTQAFP